MAASRHTPTFRSRAPRRAGLCLLAAIGLAGCEKEVVEAPTVVRPVKIFKLGDIESMRARDYPGTVRAAQNADMAFEVPGRITEFLVMEGETIEEGQELAKLDPRDYDSELDKHKANLRKAEADLTRSLSIFKEDPGAISKEKIDADKRAVGVAEATLAQADKGVEDTVLRAPFAGLMARKLVEDFQNVKAKEPVLILQDLSHLEIEVSVPERDMTSGNARLSPDALTKLIRARVVVSAIPGREFPARVKEMATTADPTTRTFQVKLIFEPPEDVTILPGMTARVVIDPEGAGGLLVPSHAPRADADGNAFVWLLDPEAMTVSQRPVELGEMSEGAVEVLSGLEQGDQIAVSGVRQLMDGMEVRRYESARGADRS